MENKVAGQMEVVSTSVMQGSCECVDCGGTAVQPGLKKQLPLSSNAAASQGALPAPQVFRRSCTPGPHCEPPLVYILQLT